MYSLGFLASVFVFFGMTVFVYKNYPLSWRENRMFRLVLLLWHLSGMISIALIFTTFHRIPSTGMKYSISRIGTFYYVMLLLLTLLFAVRLVIRSAVLWFMKRRAVRLTPEKQSILKDRRVHAMAFIAASYLITVQGYFNIDDLHTTTYRVSIPKQSALDSMTVVFLADIHAGSGNWEFTYRQLEEQINAAKPDVLLLGGDIFDETTSDQDVELVRELLEDIDPPKYGIYYVYGNHDDPGTGWAAEQMRSMGAEVLDDRMVLLGEDIQLIGHHDPTHSDLTGPELLSRLEIDDTKPVLVLTHRPKEFADLAEQGADLVLAGHTHGFNIPFFLGGPAFNDMYYGIRSYGNMTAITTSGVSAWGWHYKWPAISEIVRIELQFAK